MNQDVDRCIILGTAIGYHMEQVRPFVDSLRRSGYRGAVALWVSPQLARDAARDPSFIGIELLPAKQWMPIRLRLLKGWRRILWHSIWRPLERLACLLMLTIRAMPLLPEWRDSVCAGIALRMLTPSESRYLRYRDYLRNHPADRVLITDVRDVLFQADPFENFRDPGFFATMEPGRRTIGGDPHNTRWVEAAFGAAQLERLRNRPVSCSGVSMGDGASVLRYLDEMAAALMSLRRTAMGLSGVDQGIHNVLLWEISAEPWIPLEPFDSPVANLSGSDESKFQFDSEGRLCNHDGTVIAVVHQHDRFPRLQAHLRRRMHGKPSDPNDNTEVVDTVHGRFRTLCGDLVTRQLKRYSGHTRNELAMLLKFIRPGDVILDIGAHIGTFSIPIARGFRGTVEIHAFEPQPDVHSLLLENVRINGVADQVRAHQCAVTDSGQPMCRSERPGNTMAVSYRPTGEDAEGQVPSVPIDALVTRGELPAAVNVIKIDVEGGELAALRSASVLIRAARPILYIEVNRRALLDSGTAPWELGRFLSQTGYQFFRNVGARNSSHDRFKLARLRRLTDGGPFFDVLAIPRESNRHPGRVPVYRHRSLKSRFLRAVNRRFGSGSSGPWRPGDQGHPT